MRKFLMSGAILALLTVPALAQREDRGHDRGHGQDRSQTESRQAAQPQPAQPQPVQQQAPQQQAQQQQAPQQQGGGNHDRGENRSIAAPAATQSVPTDRSHNAGNWQNQGRDNRIENRSSATPAVIQQTTPTNRGDRDRGFGQNNRGDWNNNRNNNGSNFGNRDDNYRGNNFGNRDNRHVFGNGQRHDYSNFRDYHRTFNASHRFRAAYYRRPAGWYTHRWSFGEFLPAAFWARDYWLSDFRAYDLPPPPYGAVWVRVGSDALLVDEDSGEVISVAYAVFY